MAAVSCFRINLKCIWLQKDVTDGWLTVKPSHGFIVNSLINSADTSLCGCALWMVSTLVYSSLLVKKNPIALIFTGPLCIPSFCRHSVIDSSAFSFPLLTFSDQSLCIRSERNRKTLSHVNVHIYSLRCSSSCFEFSHLQPMIFCVVFI